jgi:hypothetical protein
MQAANEGAGIENSFGVGIRLPFEQQSNPVMNGSPRDIMYKYFFNRKESDEPELAQLPRLVVDFNKKDFARLRQLIDAINFP